MTKISATTGNNNIPVYDLDVDFLRLPHATENTQGQGCLQETETFALP